jgi:formylglycine-generating enzyme required for sulfatase activity/predicted Ser/Thr protein kinase
VPTRDQTLDLLASVIGDKYEVLQWIGGGGMADVFLARHRVHGGLFAVKVLADHLAGDRTIVERFLQEARTAASLSGHANIVPIFDIGEDRGLHYLIMQYVEGEDLAAYLEREGRLSPVQAAQVMIQVTKALVWAHSKGVIHRDLKPANIRLDPYGRVIVLDFGIAKASEVPTALTSMGERLGTPFYMSPEQIRGEVCDQRSDLYSLGVVFFELLTGRRPFGGDTYRAIEHAQIYTPAPSPSDSDPSIGPEYCRIVLRLLEKDPADRYQSAAELLEDLKSLDVGRATLTLEPQAVETAGHWPQAPAAAASTERGSRAGEPEEAPQPHIPAEPAPAGGSKAWLIFAGGGAVIALALALAVFSGRRERAPARARVDLPVASPRALPQPQIETPAGTMRLVPAGGFIFGDSSKESPNPLRTAFLPGFYIDRTEVSNGAYKQFCDATGAAFPPAPPWDANYFLAKPDYPVVNVSLDEAKAFAAWAGKRLPSEEEWEKAARGTDGRIYPWGNTPPVRQANLAGLGDGFENTAPVDAFPEGESPFGARNMAGNVWEWTASPYPVTPQEIADMKKILTAVGPAWAVIKGGNFTSEELWLRAYMRRGFPTAGRSPYIGFRCVKDAN